MPFKTDPRALAIVMVLASIFSVQLGGSFAKTIFHAVGAEGVTALRQLFSTLLLLAIFRPWNNLPDRKAWGLLALYGGLLGVMNLTFYMAMSRIPLGLAVAVEFVGPLAVAILSSRRWIDALWVACAIAGLGVLLPWQGGAGHLDPIGVMWGLVAGVCWGLYIIVSQKITDRVHGGKAVAIGMAVSCLLTVPIGVVHAGMGLWVWPVLPIGIAVAVLSSAIPYSFEMMALKQLPTKTFSLMMSLEPAAAALLGLIVLGEQLRPSQWLAIGLVIVASAGSSLTARRVPEEAVA
ncbi:MAG: DMT family transporter [Asticcacaulis sp.]